MSKGEIDFQKKLLETFRGEAEEHVRALSTGLTELEKALGIDNRPDIIEAVFREVHSLKGAARVVNLREVEVLCQTLESVFAAMKRQEIVLSPELLAALYQAVDCLDQLLSSEESGKELVGKTKLVTLTRELEGIAKGAKTSPAQVQTISSPTAPVPEDRQAGKVSIEGKPAFSEMIRLSAARLDSLLLQTEELVSAKLATGQLAVELREIALMLQDRNREWAKHRLHLRALAQAVRTSSSQNESGKLDAQANKLLEFLEWNEACIESLEDRLSVVARAADRDHHALARMVNNLLQDMKEISMMPFTSLLDAFPRLVRELARDRGKEVDLVIEGAEIEVDRRILQEIKDPLIHLVRNCIDHGIEIPEVRKRINKHARGTVRIAVAHNNSNSVEVIVSDDGAGINIDEVREVALRSGLATPEAVKAMSDQEALVLIYQSGLSTATLITEISGRGLGLAIVQEKVENLGGDVSLETHAGVGTTFRLRLPLTLVTLRGLLVRVDSHHFVLPTTLVERVARMKQEDIRTVENRETIWLNGQAVSLVRLGDVLELPVGKRTGLRLSTETAEAESNNIYVVLLASAEKRIAFQVDEILGEQEVLAKSLGPQLPRVRNIAGATILGTGQVVPIFNIPDLLKSAVKLAAAPVRTPGSSLDTPDFQKSILVVEDSITARTLLKNILEATGYLVKTAVDGVDAFTILQNGDFDLIVSDMDMPRMNGFDLTAKVRADKRLSELPVVLVTGLESKEDREQGINVGADAYIVKRSFDQSDLLEVIQRLI